MAIATDFDADASDPRNVRALQGDAVWSGVITYALVSSDQDRDGADDWSQLGAGTAFQAALAAWAAVADITFAETDAGSANLAERTGALGGDLARHEEPGDWSGNQARGTFDVTGAGWTEDGLRPGGYGFLTLLHETGHALGLTHPHEDGTFADVSAPSDLGAGDLNQSVYTVMSYNDGLAIAGGGDRDEGVWQATPAAFDIAAIQAMYGANDAHRTGADSYTLGADDAYRTIWDAGGSDVIAYDGDADAVIVLAPATLAADVAGGGVISRVIGQAGGYTIAHGARIERGEGGTGDDLILGSGAQNTVRGGAGDDLLMGLGGADTVEGGAGDDLIAGDASAALLAVRPVASLIGGGSGTFTAGRTLDNGAIGDAADVTATFAGEALAVQGTGGGEVEVFAVTLTSPFATLTLDFDADFGAAVFFADASGQTLRFGAEDGLRFAPGRAGTYYFGIGEDDGEGGLAGVADGAAYELGVRVDGEIGGRWSAYADAVEALASEGGDDLLIGGAGSDVIHGGAGDDVIYGDGA